MAFSRKRYLSNTHKALKIMTEKLMYIDRKKSLHELKQAPWYARIDSYLLKLSFTRSSAHTNLYFKTIQDIPLILVLCVDDLSLIGREPLILQCKRELSSELEMKDIGLMH